MELLMKALYSFLAFGSVDLNIENIQEKKTHENDKMFVIPLTIKIFFQS